MKKLLLISLTMFATFFAKANVPQGTIRYDEYGLHTTIEEFVDAVRTARNRDFLSVTGHTLQGLFFGTFSDRKWDANYVLSHIIEIPMTSYIISHCLISDYEDTTLFVNPAGDTITATQLKWHLGRPRRLDKNGMWVPENTPYPGEMALTYDGVVFGSNFCWNVFVPQDTPPIPPPAPAPDDNPPLPPPPAPPAPLEVQYSSPPVNNVTYNVTNNYYQDQQPQLYGYTSEGDAIYGQMQCNNGVWQESLSGYGYNANTGGYAAYSLGLSASFGSDYGSCLNYRNNAVTSCTGRNSGQVSRTTIVNNINNSKNYYVNNSINNSFNNNGNHSHNGGGGITPVNPGSGPHHIPDPPNNTINTTGGSGTTPGGGFPYSTGSGNAPSGTTTTTTEGGFPYTAAQKKTAAKAVKSTNSNQVVASSNRQVSQSITNRNTSNSNLYSSAVTANRNTSQIRAQQAIRATSYPQALRSTAAPLRSNGGSMSRASSFATGGRSMMSSNRMSFSGRRH